MLRSNYDGDSVAFMASQNIDGNIIDGEDREKKGEIGIPSFFPQHLPQKCAALFPETIGQR